MKVTTTVEIEPTHILVDAGVRYWEDATVNGQVDEEGTLIPFRDGDSWRPRINIAEGRIEDWPNGTEAHVHYKVCDDGRYYLVDADGKQLAKLDGYVPGDFLCHGSNGYGDYIIMDIGQDGKIAKYRRPSTEDLSDDGWELLAA